ncbi:MAG: hypothetical protein NTW92_09290 [Bacteroidetes bacterium]|jgi:hypothetical protein|nr:hypothetical protein [Bacteroidota bacterium]
MKKILFITVIAMTLFAACKDANQTTSPAKTGYILDSSANIDYAKQTLINCAKGDLDTYKSLYADTAYFWDNATKETLQQNVDVFKAIQAKGITIKLDGFYTAFETVNTVPDPETGAVNYTHIYCGLTFSKGDKKVYVNFYQANAIKGGKIIREWDYYDATGINELMK